VVGSAPSPAALEGPHDRPTAVELLDAVREWVAGLPLGGRDRFLARVADRALQTVGREVALGPAVAAAHQERLASVGCATDVELAQAIRDGADSPEIAAVVRAAVVDKLYVADPAQLVDR
jgi:hypothetical protein